MRKGRTCWCSAEVSVVITFLVCSACVQSVYQKLTCQQTTYLIESS